MKTKYIIIAALAAMALANTSCEKVSPQGVLMAGTAVEDRVKMSNLYYKEHLFEMKFNYDLMNKHDEYTFLVGGDSHVTTDPGRMDEMFAIGLEGDDLFYAHLGDIADTKAEYYIVLDSLLDEAKKRYVVENYVQNEYGRWVHKTHPEDIIGSTYEEIKFPFFPVVGNHDLTHNGWALWSNIFGSSFYTFDVMIDDGSEGGEPIYDHFIFLDTASGTLGKKLTSLRTVCSMVGTSIATLSSSVTPICSGHRQCSLPQRSHARKHSSCSSSSMNGSPQLCSAATFMPGTIASTTMLPISLSTL